MDYRKNQRVIATLELEDKGQDFIELDVLENGVVLGDSIMFKDGRVTLLGIGALDGGDYFTFSDMQKDMAKRKDLAGFYIYIKNTNIKKDPLPWNATTLRYKITGVKKPVKADRFISKK